MECDLGNELASLSPYMSTRFCLLHFEPMLLGASHIFKVSFLNKSIFMITDCFCERSRLCSLWESNAKFTCPKYFLLVSWIKKTCVNNDVSSRLKGRKKILPHNSNSERKIIRDMHRMYEKASQHSIIFKRKEIENSLK